MTHSPKNFTPKCRIRECLSDHGLWAYVIPRISVGILFLVAGVSKLVNYSGPTGWLRGQMFDTFKLKLPAFMVSSGILKGYFVVLPWVETVVGALLLIGLFTRPTLVIAGLTLVSINLGMAIAQSFDIVARNFIYILMVSFLLAFVHNNGLSADCFLRNAMGCGDGDGCCDGQGGCGCNHDHEHHDHEHQGCCHDEDGSQGKGSGSCGCGGH